MIAGPGAGVLGFLVGAGQAAVIAGVVGVCAVGLARSSPAARLLRWVGRTVTVLAVAVGVPILAAALPSS